MTQAAKAQEPSMEEILASIRRIIADDDTKPAAKPEPPAAKAPPPPPPPAPKPAPPPAAAMGQDDIDAMLAGLDEPEAPKVQPSPPPMPAPSSPEPDVLELTESMQAVPPPAPAFRTIDGRQDVVFDEVSEPPPRMERPRPAPALSPAPPQVTEQLISSATAAAVDSAFNALAQTVLMQNATTLEDLVKEMLRPMLQHWLDNNLPTLVERLVRQEIERVARGR
jgi:cell pole-organizing protein PopZ